MRVIFMGTPDYATAILEGLIEDENIEVVAVFTQPDKPVGRKKILTPPDVKRFLIEENIDIPIFQPINLKNKNIQKDIKELNPDFIVVAAYGQILPKEILDIAPCINLHASILPKYRGASPIQQALLNGDDITGVTAMLMDEGLDTGDILAYSIVNIEKNDVAPTLFEKLSLSAKILTPKVLKNYHKISPVKQNSVDASYCKKIKKDDGLVDFVDAKTVYNKYRAFYFWPGIFLKSGLKLLEIDIADEEGSYEKGKILELSDNGVIVGCEKGKIEIIKVQPPSKKSMDIFSYLRGRRIGIGDYLS
ncbi:methionyl-tRNA formyltransferase [Nitrosophilus kaiyonis]|uniref:methionyl-tRNA formyltransferase n=1 Tax=Nitrosophilus kaiyonis TaxID=2930200 RepID=UPI0024910B35|nr:methionyl-tRNA formyltransferase [Nitrosophilus kaiyonis]